MAAFIGRKNEESILQSILDKPSASVMIYGKRKVGKTTLLSHVLNGSKDTTVYYECLKSTMQENIDGFVSVLVTLHVLPIPLPFASFVDVFSYLNTLDKTFKN